ncbi:MAG: YciI family protein [bacterium]|nr:YciI family protein [bacterium]
MFAMPQYLYRIQPTRLEMLHESTLREQEIVGQHFRYLQQLMAEGTLILAGRTLNTDDSTFGIVIFNASDDDAQAIATNDPAVMQRVMRAEVFPYRVALIQETNAK